MKRPTEPICVKIKVFNSIFELFHLEKEGKNDGEIVILSDSCINYLHVHGL